MFFLKKVCEGIYIKIENIHKRKCFLQKKPLQVSFSSYFSQKVSFVNINLKQVKRFAGNHEIILVKELSNMKRKKVFVLLKYGTDISYYRYNNVANVNQGPRGHQITFSEPSICRQSRPSPCSNTEGGELEKKIVRRVGFFPFVE